MEQEITGRIEGWRLDSETWEGYTVIRGYIYDDKRGFEFRDGNTIRTSDIACPIEDCVEGALIKTRNSLYLLGKPYENA